MRCAFTNSKKSEDTNQSFSEIFRLHARLRPGKEALVSSRSRYDYRQLDRSIDSACHVLHLKGVTSGNLVGVALHDTNEHLITLLALARMGATILPVDCRWSQKEKETVVSHFNADHVLVEDDMTPAGNWHLVEDGWFSGSDKPYIDPEVTRDTPLLLSLSSGTTGLPKGPRLSHGQFENRFMAYWINLGFNAHDRFVSATPLYFGGGRGFSLAMLHCGGTVHMFPPPYKPEELADYTRSVNATSLFLVPTLLRRMLGTTSEELVFPTLRCLVSSGSALFMEERQAIRDRLTPNLYELYSSTEGGSVSVLGPGDFLTRPDSVGRACFRVQIEVVSNDHEPLSYGEVGRLRYRSPASPDGYYLGDGSDAFRDGWFYPGDLAALDDEGFLSLRGRSKDMIIRGGVNIYPGDIEKVLLTHPRVADTAVIGVPSPEFGEDVVAYVVARDAVDVDELKALCKVELASYKVPRSYRLVEALPKNALGKTLKSRLVEMFEAERAG